MANMEDLPVEMQEHILSFLPAKLLMDLRTCGSFFNNYFRCLQEKKVFALEGMFKKFDKEVEKMVQIRDVIPTGIVTLKDAKYGTIRFSLSSWDLARNCTIYKTSVPAKLVIQRVFYKKEKIYVEYVYKVLGYTPRKSTLMVRKNRKGQYYTPSPSFLNTKEKIILM